MTIPTVQPQRRARPSQRRKRDQLRGRGLTIVELLVSLAIVAMLLTATMVATDACFKAYADAAEQASSQAATRMVANRLLTLVRTSTLHGPLSAAAAFSLNITDPDDGTASYTVTVPAATLSGNTVTSSYFELIDPDGQLITISYLQYTNKAGVAKQELWMTTDRGAAAEKSQPLLGGVTTASFQSLRRLSSDDLWVLQRGTMDLTIQPGTDATLAVEHGHPTPIRVIASTMPRKVE